MIIMKQNLMNKLNNIYNIMSDDGLTQDPRTKYKKTKLYQSDEHKGSPIDSPYYEDIRYIYLYSVKILNGYNVDLNTVRRIAEENITELFMKYPNIPRKDIIGTVMTELKESCIDLSQTELGDLSGERMAATLIILAKMR